MLTATYIAGTDDALIQLQLVTHLFQLRSGLCAGFRRKLADSGPDRNHY